MIKEILQPNSGISMCCTYLHRIVVSVSHVITEWEKSPHGHPSSHVQMQRAEVEFQLWFIKTPALCKPQERKWDALVAAGTLLPSSI